MLSIYVKEKDRIYPLFALITSTLFFIIGLFLVKEKWFPFYLLGIIILLAFFGFHRVILKVLKIVIPISIIITLLALIGTTPTNAIQNGLRTLLLGISSIISLSIEPVDLVRNLNQLKFPRLLSLGILITLRFLGVINEEMKRIRVAMKTRGASDNIFNPQVFYRAFLIPLFMRIISISDMLSVSLDTRGFKTEGNHTVYKELRINLKSIVFFVFSIIMIALSVILKIGKVI